MFIGRVRDALLRGWAIRHEECGLTQADLARILGVNRSRVSRILNGEANLTLRTAGEIAAALGFELDVEIADVSSFAVTVERIEFDDFDIDTWLDHEGPVRNEILSLEPVL